MKCTKDIRRRRQHIRIRKKIFGTEARPRLCVHRSLKNLYCQLIDDSNRRTMLSISTLDKQYKQNSGKTDGGNAEAAKLLGKLLAEEAGKKGITKVVFDRGGYLYHGRVKILAEAAREGGLQF